LFRDWLAQLALGLVHCGELESLRYTQLMADEPEFGHFLESQRHFFGEGSGSNACDVVRCFLPVAVASAS
jgi:hypothetical protein